MQHMGYSPTSGTARTALAALKKFGLLEEVDRNVRITARALDILHPDPEKQRYAQALKEAALEPAIHRELWERFDESLPSDANLRYHLVRERQFNEAVVEDFIGQFRSTLALAGLIDQDIDDGGAGSDMSAGPRAASAPNVQGVGGFRHPAGTGGPSYAPDPKSRVLQGGPQVVFDLPGGNAIEIRLRSKVSREDFEKVKRIFELSEMAFVEEASAGKDQDLELVA
jgi:hypothetical protein